MKESLEILLSSLIEHKETKSVIGLCNAAGNNVDLLNYIHNNRPAKDLHPQFFDNEYYNRFLSKCSDSNLSLKPKPLFFWPLYNIDVRIEFVKYLITLQ